MRNKIDSDLSVNLIQALEMYNSHRFLIHFNNAIGSGKEETGGKHSFNFSNDLELLDRLLLELKVYSPILILEQNETDYVHRPQARWLNDYIENFKQ